MEIVAVRVLQISPSCVESASEAKEIRRTDQQGQTMMVGSKRKLTCRHACHSMTQWSAAR